jgi:hypothetical protein
MEAGEDMMAISQGDETTANTVIFVKGRGIVISFIWRCNWKSTNRLF